MIKYILKKLFFGLISIIAVISTISAIIYFSKVDPASLSFGQRNNPTTIALLKSKYYLDQPIQFQILRYLEDLSPVQWIQKEDVRLSDYTYTTMIEASKSLWICKFPYLRKSYVTGQKVSAMIWAALPSTLWLAVLSMIIALTLGIVLGIMCVKYHASWIDQTMQSICTLGFSVPSYISAIFFSIVFGYILGPFIGLEIQGSLYGLDDYGNVRMDWRNIILPALALGIRPLSMICQMTRASVLEIKNLDYVRTAKAKGLSEYKIMLVHILRNALNPIVSTVSGWFASLLSGAFFVEFVFNYAGLGSLTINGLNQYDIPLVLASCVIVTILFVSISIITDLLYYLLDPRIKMQ